MNGKSIEKERTASWQCVDSPVTNGELLQRLRLSKGGEGAVYRGAGRGSGGRGEGKKGEKWRFRATRALPRK